MRALAAKSINLQNYPPLLWSRRDLHANLPNTPQIEDAEKAKVTLLQALIL